ncbi:uncharacterized protein LOC123873369 [Maniola jurtina]|uniref:uncharacterized protein LOC123873369 n=1 Tax=Maniola jurtina TaxID=191418 RepID=UPI001E689D85|nr:uncharacterized protein LOC123873369 [Maniola jurtina]XP_045774169.1 uncharacterized protein LOC123873369 [Maniola jurtina]XP_045774170.1 uncharacterized protein LOC123873369 [Maniola jurtina]XP_045774171.1 uncharacterized protein LOC123873369 [Maniola jurtina]
MDQMQAPVSLPHIVQVYPPSVSIHPSLQSQGKLSYQQTITSESLHIPVSSHIHEMQNQHLISQNQTVMSCQQIHLQNVQPLQAQMQSQVLQGDMSQQLQITSHVILPPVPMFKQHLLTNTLQQQFYGQYETFLKDAHCVVAKVEPVQVVSEKQIEVKPECQVKGDSVDVASMKKRARNQIPNPSKWACNVRKLKHQRGEAYVSRRGKLVPERRVRNTKDCLKSCRYKCNERINDVDRQHIFKAFYSLNANEKKHFLLNTTERNYVKHNKLMDGNHKRKYSFKYFFLVRAVRYTVCKNFYLGTLAISQKPVYNVHSGKSEMNLPKPDGRGLSEASAHSLPTEVKDRVRKHIMSFPTVDSKPIKQFSRKKQYLESNLTIKQMYNMYVTDCGKDDEVLVKESMYRKIFKQEFNLHFKKDKNSQVLCCRCKSSIKKK